MLMAFPQTPPSAKRNQNPRAQLHYCMEVYLVAVIVTSVSN